MKGLKQRLVRLALAATITAIAAVALAGPAAPPLTPSERSVLIEALRDADAIGDRGEAPTNEALWAAAVRHAREELGQRIRPSQVDSLWALEPARRDVEAELAAARRSGRLQLWIAELRPRSQQHRALLSARERYAAIADAGGWPPLPAGPTLRAGEQHAQVALLRTRLGLEGYGAPAAQRPELLDPALAGLLKTFQRRHALQADGVLGPRTRAALNVTAEDRLAQIEANLERRRWLPRPMPADRLEVDVGGAVATLYRSDAPILQMKAVVGDPQHRTPMFASRVEAIVFNPPWRVPTSIASREILPRAARDPGYLARNDFHYVDGRLEQRPGPKNALGAVKFDLPSPFGVYLHDTPARSAFARESRALSHGCMRLEKPRELAAELLGRQGGGMETVESAIASGETTRIQLKTPLPLHVLYWTAVAGGDGEVIFRPDVYGWDRKLAAALGGSGRATRAALSRNGTDCANAA